MMGKIKVVIIDDSSLVRKVLTETIDSTNDMVVVGAAPNPYIGRDMIVKFKPDVLLLDIEMPKMDGLTFLEKLMTHYPMPVIVVSSLGENGGEVALKALELGALEVIKKPGASYAIKDMKEQLIDRIRIASKVKSFPKLKFDKNNLKKKNKAMIRTTNKVVAIGASTGGTIALTDLLSKLPANIPPILIVQHMPEGFTNKFAERLNTICKFEVKEAQNGDYVISGRALIAPGNKHMTIKREGANYLIEINNGPLIFHQRPSVEVLFYSMAQFVGKNAVGVILTGMGKDGAKGILEMKKNGAYTIAQDEKSCIVFGMPKEAISLGGIDDILPLSDIPFAIMKYIEKNK
jgi:two-component system chemotaxis response regulator CheB